MRSVKAHYFLTTISLFTLSLGASGCKNDDGCPPPIGLLASSAYSDPVWHPAGIVLGFNHVPLKRIELKYNGPCLADVNYTFQNDSSGFWLIDSTGRDMRRVFPHLLNGPSWSPDGQWLAIELVGNIFKIRFTGNSIDSTSLVQLTVAGGNYSPAWSPDGQWIAYDRSLEDTSGPAGIWVMRGDGTARRSLFGAAYPSWFPDGASIIAVHGISAISNGTKFIRFYLTPGNQSDTLNAIVGNENLNPKVSSDGKTIAFWSQSVGGVGNIWLMNGDGTNIRQLTTEGAGQMFAWNNGGDEIVFLSFRYTDYTISNGVFWMINVGTGEKRQLTFNH